MKFFILIYVLHKYILLPFPIKKKYEGSIQFFMLKNMVYGSVTTETLLMYETICIMVFANEQKTDNLTKSNKI